MSSISQYLRERFPLQAVVPLSVGTAAWLVGLSKSEPVSFNVFLVTLLVALGFISFLLRIRVTDEFKDSSHDFEHYPNRPVPRGLITRKTLVLLGLFCLALELLSVLAAATLRGDATRAFSYLLVIVFSALTAVEFFAPKWLAEHFNIYFISHQLVFVFYAVWGCALFDTPQTQGNLAGLIAFILVMAAIEVIRKFELRTNTAGEVVQDTYLAVWGRIGSIGVLSAISIFNGILLSVWSGSWIFIAAGLVTVTALVIVRRNDRAIQATMVLSFLAHGLVVWLL